jgi:hypothetical protein
MSLEDYVEETSFTLSNEAQQFMDAGLEEVFAMQRRIAGQIALNNLACTTCNQKWFDKWETSLVTAEITAMFNSAFARMHLRIMNPNRPMSIQSTPTRPISLISLQSDAQCVLEFFKFDDDMPSVHSGYLIPGQQPTETRLFTGITDIPVPAYTQTIKPYKFYKFRSDIPHRLVLVLTQPTALDFSIVKFFTGTNFGRY